jgi:hypothetical protein
MLTKNKPARNALRPSLLQIALQAAALHRSLLLVHPRVHTAAMLGKRTHRLLQ